MISFQNVAGVTIGGTLGHSLCTGLAVIGGRLIAQRISVRTGKSIAANDENKYIMFKKKKENPLAKNHSVQFCIHHLVTQ